jgi:type II secretory pathway predicted ATPase ExeA
MPLEGGRVLRHLPGGQDSQSAVPSSSGLFSLTYEPYYGLLEKPFSLSADPRFLFRSPEHAPAFDELLNGIRRREGLITLTGEIGTGKTTLIRSVLQHLDRRTFSAFVPDPFVSREDLLKMLLVDFGVVSIADLKRGSLNGASRPDLSYPLYEFLDSLVPLQAFAVLIIDEAQNLPLPLLEEVRILSDLEGREKLLQVVLVGQPELRANLKLPELRQVNQRVSVRCELTPLGKDGVAGYVAHRLRIAGEGQARVEFSDAAIDAVYQSSGGTPRLINLICDRALHRGFAARVGRIEPGFVWDAAADLGLEAGAVKSTAPAPAAPKVEPVAPRVSVPLLPSEPIAQTLFAPVQTRSAVRVPRAEREVLAEFAPEEQIEVPNPSVDAGIARGWMLVGGVVLVAILALGAMFAYVRVQTLSAIPPLTFPSTPLQIVPTIEPVLLPDPPPLGPEPFPASDPQ